MGTSSLPNIPEGLFPALEIFLCELDDHLGYFHDHLGVIFEQGFDQDSHQPAEIIHHKFHTIKGGASFFQLEDIRESAARAEELLETPITAEHFVGIRQELEAIVTLLSDQLDLMREVVGEKPTS